MSSVAIAAEPQAAADPRLACGASREHVEVLGLRLAVDDTGGDGAIVVCLHAIGHGAGDYALLRERVGAKYRLIALDWPGHGGSADDREPTSAARYADVLEAFLAARGLDGVVLVGNSVGGAAALAVASRSPRVRALVVANPGGVHLRSLLARWMTRAMAAFFDSGARRRWWFGPAYAAFCRAILQRPAADAQRQRIAAAGYATAALLGEAWRSFGDPSSDLRDIVATLRVPTLVMWATRDPVNPLWANRAGIARIPGHRLVQFACGHQPFLEQPDEAAAAFVAFVDGLPA